MRILLVAAALLFVPGCGTDETSPTTPADDGKIRPAPSGTRTTEALACKAFSDTHSKQMLAVGCAGTTRTCPSLLRTQSGGECLEYDQGSLDGCLAYIKEQTTCAGVADSVDKCIVYAYEGSAPAGCP